MNIALASLVLFGAAAVAGVAQPNSAHSAAAGPASRSITVTGSGTVETVPDRAVFSFTVSTNAGTAKAALARTTTRSDAVVAALRGARVQTSELSLVPRTNDAGTAILGYTASTTVSADAELAQAGGLIDAAVDAGADGVSGPAWSRSDRDALYRNALRAAVADARAKAAALADGAGLTLGELTSLTEGGDVAQPAVDALKLEPGTQTIDASVTVTFAALAR
jgi:uncharacterized protein YggE